MAQPKRRAATAKAEPAPPDPKQPVRRKRSTRHLTVKRAGDPIEDRQAAIQYAAGMEASSPPKAKKARAARKAKAPKLRRETIGGILEPNWVRLLPDTAEQAAASEHWRRVAHEMNEQEILSLANGHALQRLVLAYLVYDRCSKNVAAEGLVTAPSKDNPKSIARLSIHYKAMREAENTAERLEAQLGLTPGKRGRVGKVTKKRERTAGADAFLNPA